jgi:DNA repair photolyase
MLTDVASMTSVTPYALCDYRCVYCLTGVQGASKPVVTAEQAVRAIREHLAAAESPPKLCLGAISDAYPKAEREFGITRAIVQELVAAGCPFNIVTKSDIILRDLDLLVAHGERAYVQVSISSTDDDVLRRIDLGAPSGTKRFGVIDELHRAGVPVGLNLLPWIPEVSDTEAIIDRVPSEIEIVLAPLSMAPDTDRRQFLGRTYIRDEVWRRYMDEYFRLGHIGNTSWIKPSPPPHENNPYDRLPTLNPSGRATQRVEAWSRHVTAWRRDAARDFVAT